MLFGQPGIPLPEIDRVTDEVSWQAPVMSQVMAPTAPMASMRSTVFHHTCKLMVLGRQAVEKLCVHLLGG